MNLSKTLFMIALSIIIFSACKKEKHDPSIVGFWTGKYGNSTAYPDKGYAFLFRNNGTVRVFNNSDTAAAAKAEGTYSVTGTTIALTYTYIEGGDTYSAAASANSGLNFMEGTWGHNANTTNGGRFFVNKQ